MLVSIPATSAALAAALSCVAPWPAQAGTRMGVSTGGDKGDHTPLSGLPGSKGLLTITSPKSGWRRFRTFDHYSVLDIWEPSFYNVARQYQHRGRVEQPHWLVAPRIASL